MTFMCCARCGDIDIIDAMLGRKIKIVTLRLLSLSCRHHPIVFQIQRGHMVDKFVLRPLIDCINKINSSSYFSFCFGRRAGIMSGTGNYEQDSAAVHIWVRAETKPNEARAPLIPQACKDLLNAGIKVTVERSHQRIFLDEEYEKAGCTLVPNGTWKDAPKKAFIVGIKELPNDSFPLVHRHIYFGHVYKNQEGWQELLGRFKAGGGALLDVEYMCLKDGRRAVAEFSPVAGAVGAALGVELWTFKQLQNAEKFIVPFHYKSEEDFLVHLRSCLNKVSAGDEALKSRPKVMVMGALGRCGRGATSMLEKIGLKGEQIIRWDLEETKKGGPFSEILDFDVFVNCIYLPPGGNPMPPFLHDEMLKSKDRNLTVVVDVSCDTSNPNNPLPFVKDITTFKEPVFTVNLGEGEKPLDVIAIDHLPSMLPREASMNHSAKLALQLVDLVQIEKSVVWMSALNTFHEKVSLI